MYRNKMGFILTETCICVFILSMLVFLTTSIVNRISQSKQGQKETIDELEQDINNFIHREIKCSTEEDSY